MPKIQPFAGLRYAQGPDLSAVVAPPYDMVDDRESFQKRHRDNAVQLILPDTYEAAAQTFIAWQRDGTLMSDQPSLYTYRMSWSEDGSEHETRGVIGALAVEGSEGDTPVLPHEHTLPKVRGDRLALLRATNANFDPVWGLTLAPYFSTLISSSDPLAFCVDDAGVRHEIARVDDEHVENILAAIATSQFVLADGHHRFDVARGYTRDPDAPPGADSIMCLVTECSEDQLHVEPIHRELHNIPEPLSLRDLLSGPFDVIPFPSQDIRAVREEMNVREGMALIDRAGTSIIVPTEGTRRVVAARTEREISYVDACVFEEIAVPLLPESAHVEYPTDAEQTARAVGQHQADAAILLRPPDVHQIQTAALAGVRMPQKTTLFVPKPRTGMVFRSLL